MNRAIVSKRQIAILLGIVGLISAVVAFLLARRAPPFYLEVAMRSSESGTAQVYYDTGTGINAADSTSVRLRDGESAVRLPLPAGEYRAIRFDPIDHGYCQITIHRARIIDLSGHVVRPFSPEEFSEFHDISQRQIANGAIDLKLNASESDPSFTIFLAAPLTLRPSAWPFWQLALEAFFLCFIPVSALGVIWLWFAPRRWPWHGLLLCALGAFLYLGARTRFFAPITFDEEIFIWSGWVVKNGGVPYKDLFQPKPPVIFFANALGLALFGLKDFLFRTVPTTVALTSIAVFYAAMIKRRIVPWLAVLLTAQVALWLLSDDFHDTGLNDSETYGFAFTVLGFSLGSIGSSLRRRFASISLQVLSGICFGLAVLSKELFVFSVIPAWLLCAHRSDGGKWDWRQLLYSAIGGGAVAISFVAYLATHSAFDRYLAVLRYARMFANNYCVDIGKFPKVSGLSVLLPCLKMLHSQLYNFSHLAFVLPLWVSFLFVLPRSRKTTKLSQLAIASAAVVLGTIAVSIGYCFWKHYFLMGTTGLLLLSVIGAEALSNLLAGRGPRASALAFAGCAALFLFVAKQPTEVMFTQQYYIPQIGVWDPIVVETIERHSQPGDYILSTESPLLYVVMNRKSPIPVSGADDGILPYMAAENPQLQMEFLRNELEKNLPKVCYFAGWYRPRQKMWHELLYDPLIIKHHYVQVNDRLWYLPEEE